eukprot:403360970
MCTPLFNKMLLKQKIDKKNWIFSSLCGLGIYFIHEFVSVKQQTSTSLQVDTVQDNLIYQEDFSDSWIMLIQTRQFNLFGDQSLTQNPEFYYQEILPLLFSILSGIIGPLQHILNMRFLLKEAFKRKLKLRLRNQIQILKESEVNLDALTKDQMLHPRKVLKNSQVFRRYVAVYEGFNKKEVVKQSQVRAQGQVLKTNGGILIPYKKANYIPMSFSKIFVRNKQPKSNQQKTQVQNQSNNLIDAKTKKFHEQMHLDKKDYQQNLKIKVSNLTKSISKSDPLSHYLKKQNNKSKRYLQKLRDAKSQNPQLRMFDELDFMISSFTESMFHLHLFSDFDEIHLTKLDLLYANGHYLFEQDTRINISLSHALFLNYACEQFLMFPMLLIIDMLVNQTQTMSFYNLYTQQYDLWKEQVDRYFSIIILFGVILALKPIAGYYMKMIVKPQEQRKSNLINTVIIYFAYLIFMRGQYLINLKEFLSFFLINYLVVYIQEHYEEKFRTSQDSQIIQLLKGNFFPLDHQSGKKFENQLKLIHSQFKSSDTFHQIINSCLLSNHPKAVNHLAPSVMPLRKYFVQNYYKITSQWAGGYPLPIIEFADSLWDFNDQSQQYKGHQRDLIVQRYAELTRPDIDVSDMIYHRQMQWESEYGQIVSNMQKYRLATFTMDFNNRKTYRDYLRQKALDDINKKQHDQMIQEQEKQRLLREKQKYSTMRDEFSIENRLEPIVLYSADRSKLISREEQRNQQQNTQQNNKQEQQLYVKQQEQQKMYDTSMWVNMFYQMQQQFAQYQQMMQSQRANQTPHNYIENQNGLQEIEEDEDEQEDYDDEDEEEDVQQNQNQPVIIINGDNHDPQLNQDLEDTRLGMEDTKSQGNNQQNNLTNNDSDQSNNINMQPQPHLQNNNYDISVNKPNSAQSSFGVPVQNDINDHQIQQNHDQNNNNQQDNLQQQESANNNDDQNDDDLNSSQRMLLPDINSNKDTQYAQSNNNNNNNLVNQNDEQLELSVIELN